MKKAPQLTMSARLRKIAGAGLEPATEPAAERVARRAGVPAGELRSKVFRHTYCAARLQTLDRGAPVSLYTVSRELGHGSEDMVRRVYAHLGEVRHRAEVVEFRVEQHVERLGDRLPRLGLPMPSVTRNVTTEAEEEDTKTPDAGELTMGEQLPRAGDRTRTCDVQLRKRASPTRISAHRRKSRS
jgi:hypothetical protein